MDSAAAPTLFVSADAGHREQKRGWSLAVKHAAKYDWDMYPDDEEAPCARFRKEFAELKAELARATFHLRKRNQPELVFETVSEQETNMLLQQLERELKVFEGRRHVDPCLHLVREACQIASELEDWRKDPVQSSDAGRNDSIVEQKIRLAQRAEVGLNFYGQLLRTLEFDKEVDAVVDKALPE